MEQSRGPNIPLVQAAGTDPAYVPGILVPQPDGDDRTEAAASGTGGAPDAPADATTGTVPSPATAAEESDTETETDTETDTEGEDDGEATEGSGEDRVFEAADRRGAIRADRHGLVFRLDDTEAEFPWKEIRAVEIDVPKWGHRFGVTVYLSERRWFETWADAPSRRQLRAWSDEFDAILDIYFEPGTEKHDPAEQ
ncbi:hypothetical protein ABZZ36_42120 [Actinacidiphila glaucinigra]|uniref:hypothetical protein n=1 Tax=Actinacidiphila glaucinigra TaxID=235986 RepID=UPI0033ACF92E